MRILIQRVIRAQVEVEGQIVGKIARGMVVFLGIGSQDQEEDRDWLIAKILKLRIFEDEKGKMNKSIQDIPDLGVLLISQFTLYGSTKKGNRPSFTEAAAPQIAKKQYQLFGESLRKKISVQTGKFGAHMNVSLVNDGPVTLWLDSKNRM